MTNIEKEQILQNKEIISNLETRCRQYEGDFNQYKIQADQLESELDNLLQINEMYQDTIRQLEEVIENKDLVIQDHLTTIARLTEGNVEELKNIKLMFFTKQNDLVDQISI